MSEKIIFQLNFFEQERRKSYSYLPAVFYSLKFILFDLLFFIFNYIMSEKIIFQLNFFEQERRKSYSYLPAVFYSLKFILFDLLLTLQIHYVRKNYFLLKFFEP